MIDIMSLQPSLSCGLNKSIFDLDYHQGAAFLRSLIPFFTLTSAVSLNSHTAVHLANSTVSLTQEVIKERECVCVMDEGA